MNKPPFCVDCKHRSKLMGTQMCNRTTDLLDITTGKFEVLFVPCYRQREDMHRLFKTVTCGTEGRFFQQNNTVWYNIKKWFSKFK